MIELKNKAGDVVPSIGLGTFPFQGRVMVDMVKSAVEAGYRIFDTADDYRGESGIGDAIHELEKEGIAKREDLFIQTKISDNNAWGDEPLRGVYFNPESKVMKRHSCEEIVREKVATSLRELQTDYIDSLLIHYPFPGYTVEVWKAMIELKKEGLVRYIGVSNFHERHLDVIINATGVTPEINECYASPVGTKQSLVEYCNAHGILFETYSPLKDIAGGTIPVDKLQPLMEKYGKSAAQVVLRWNLDRGCLPLPKTKSPHRMIENMNVFDFSLTMEEVESLCKLNENREFVVESKICPGI